MKVKVILHVLRFFASMLSSFARRKHEVGVSTSVWHSHWVNRIKPGGF